MITSEPQRSAIHWTALFAALCFALAFQFHFYSAVLYNSAPEPENRLTRAELLLLHTSPLPNEHLKAVAGNFESVENLAQRGPVLAAAFAILLTAWILGDLLRVLIFQQRARAILERIIIGYGLGTAALSLLVQLLGLAGMLNQPVFAAAAGVVVALRLIVWFFLRTAPADPVDQPVGERGFRWPVCLILLVVMLAFAATSLLAAMLPTPDYDALAYHLLGPKEYWLNGRITFLEHNVYTTFPFLTEMYHLAGMVVADNWFVGGLVGQTVLWSFGPMTALAVGALCGRFFGSRAAWLGATVYLATPWVYRLSSIPYVEGAMLFYFVLAFYSATVAPRSVRWAAISGCLGGAAVGCKYTALLMVAPVVLIALLTPQGRRATQVLAFAVGFGVIAGPWFVRNVAWTGNPVYPLAYEIFGGADWSSAKAEKFDQNHRPTDHSLNSLKRYVAEIPIHSDWQSGVVFAFAPMALLGVSRKAGVGLWLLMLYELLAFWIFTHRLDRFWLPLLPFAVAAAAAGMVWSRSLLWRSTVALSLCLMIVYNAIYCVSGWCGLNAYTDDLGALRQRVAHGTNQSPTALALVDSPVVPAEAKVLCVGLAAVYYCERTALYNTVFDDHRFIELVRLPDSNELKPTNEIRTALAREGVDFVLVDWTWIKQYRSPGNYGYPAWVRPEVFDEMKSRGVLEQVLPPFGTGPYVLYRVIHRGAGGS